MTKDTTQPMEELEEIISDMVQARCTPADAVHAIAKLISLQETKAREKLLDALESHKKTLDYIVKVGAPRNPTNYEVYMRKALEVDGKIAQLNPNPDRKKVDV